ncbi:LuxR family transcriptional regulator [Streptomyces sp. NPDC059788]|uniref:LuxR family transcriptional regulator n=1 Tax=Streptomyces sp. NPDC059788 TaxID=3346948 RepID=UPI0036691221
MSAGAEGPPPPGIAGRAAEHSALRGLLARTPLVTVTGPANVGKSTLARTVLEEAARNGGGLDGGFVRVGCREDVDASGVAAALNRAAGLPYDTPPEALAAHCARRGLTVLLDDCDPMTGACAWLVRQLLRAGGRREAGADTGAGTDAGADTGAGSSARAGLRIVATSRQPLGLGAEHVVAVRPLPAAAGGPVEPHVPRAAHEAHNPPDVPDSSAAATLGTAVPPTSSPLGPPRPVPAPVAAPGPHSPTDRLVWARLSVLPGDFDGWLAGCVAGSSDVSAQQVEAALERLSRAMVLDRLRQPPATTAPARPPSPPRYRLPATARAIGLARLRAAGEEAATLRAFRMACAALAAEAQIAWQGPDRRTAVRLVETERHHLQAALTRPSQGADDALTALDIAVSLWFRWAVCGRRREGRAHLDRLLRRSGDDTAVRARALWLAGWLAAQDHARRAAGSLLDRAARAAARHADADTLARVAHARGVLALRRADPRTAAAYLRRAAEHPYQDAWYGPGPAYSRALLAIALAAPEPAGAPASGPAAVATAGATTAGSGTGRALAAASAPAVQGKARSGPLPGPRCGHHFT